MSILNGVFEEATEDTNSLFIASWSQRGIFFNHNRIAKLPIVLGLQYLRKDCETVVIRLNQE